MSSDERKAADEELLAALLGRADEQRLARARLRAAGREAELRALELGLARAADELSHAPAWSARQEARFVGRVLEATTRRDLSWRGDVRLAWDFLRARLRASPALRLVAASLALHLVAGPVVAYWMLRERAPERRVRLEFELPSEEPFAPAAPPPAPETDELVRLARAREARENEHARARFVLLQHGPSAPALVLAPGAPRALELLAARARLLRAPTRAGEDAGPAPSTSEPLGLALWVELELDRRILSGSCAAELGPACLALTQIDARALGARAPGTAEIVASSIERATRLGLLERAASTPAAAGSLLDASWFEALARAGAEHGLGAHEAWRTWLAWGETRGVSVR